VRTEQWLNIGEPGQGDLVGWLSLQQIQAALRQGDQDIAANHGHDLGEVLADLDGKPSPAQPPSFVWSFAWQKPILARPDDFQAPPRSPIVSSPAPKPAT